MKKKSLLIILLALILAITTIGVIAASPLPKIVPPQGEPGDDFTIVCGNSLSHREGINGAFVQFISLDDPYYAFVVNVTSNKPYVIARGRLPDEVAPGDYRVDITLTDGTIYSGGVYTVLSK